MKLKSYFLSARTMIFVLMMLVTGIASAQTYNVIITVSNGPLGLMDAAVTLDGETVYTDFYGEAWFYNKAPNSYPYTATKTGFVDGSGTVNVVDADVWEYISLTPLPTFNVIITVSDGPLGLMDAAVTLDGETVYTDFYGEAWFYGKTPESYPYTVTKTGYLDGSGTVDVVDGDVWEYITLIPAPVTYNVIITVSDGPLGLMDAAVTLDGETVYTDFYGEAWFYNKLPDSYPYTVTKEGYYDGSGTVDVVDGDVWEYIALTPLPPTYNVIITVSDGPLPVQDAYVTLDGETVMTDFYGEAWFMDKDTGTYYYNVHKEGYNDGNGSVDVIDADVWEYINLVPLGSVFNIIITVADGPLGVMDASVTLDGETVYTDFYGEAWFFDKDPGDYPYEVTKEGYNDASGMVTVVDGDVWEFVSLIPLDTYSATFIVDDGSAPVENAEIDLEGSIMYTNAMGEAVFTGLLPGIYPYSITLDGYIAETGEITVTDQDITVGVTLIWSSLPENSLQVKFYPNPSNGIVHIENVSGYRIQISDQAGVTIINQDIRTGNNAFDLTTKPAGIYTIRMTNDQETITRKLILVR